MKGLDVYLARMTSHDIHVHGPSLEDAQDVRRYYLGHLQQPTPEERAVHARVLSECRQVFKESGCHLLASVTPDVMMFTAPHYFPHTIGDTVVLPRTASSALSTVTMCHEIIHVFQRSYPVNTHHIVEGVLGYRKVAPSTDVALRERFLLRANPDVDDYFYGHERWPRGLACAQVYDHAFPASLADSKPCILNIKTGDVIGPTTYEHPFEHMAYALTDMVLERRVSREWATVL